MRFTISGHHNGQPASITWEDGNLTGDDDAIRALRDLAEECEFVEVICMGRIPAKDLAKPLAARLLMGEVLEPITGTSGRLPKIPTAPPGAVN